VIFPIISIILAVSATPPPTIFATPTPAPELPTIITLHARPLCTALHKIVLPFAATEKRNNDTFKVMDKELVQYHKWDSHGTATDLGANGSNTGNGVQLLQAGRIDQQASLMYQNLADIETQLAHSYREIPAGKDPALDELRARIDNIVKLQYALAAKYDAIAGRTLDSTGLLNIIQDPAYSSQMLIPDFNQNPISDSFTPPPAGALKTPDGSDSPVDSDFLIRAQGPDLYRGMLTQEVAFVKPAISAVRTCDGQ
jgi:hypothetical protein